MTYGWLLREGEDICMLMKTSVVCLLLMIYMIGFYYRKPHIPIKATRLFRAITAAALITAVFDLLTLYTVNHRDTVPEGVNLALHIVYLLSILGYINFLFLYMRSFLESSLKFGKTLRVLQSLPALYSALGIFVLPITYVHGETTDYSLGPKAYALYASLVFYLLCILYYCLRYWRLMDSDKRLAIVLAVPIFTVVGLIQMFFPETLIVIVASTLILLGLILSNENTEKYLDEKTGLFNRYSFETVLGEFDFEKNEMVAAVFCFCKTENNPDWEQDIRIFQSVYRRLRQYRLRGYRVCENGVVFLAGSEDRARAILEELEDIVRYRYGKERISVETEVFVGKSDAARHECMRSIIDFCAETGSSFAFIDYLTNLYNRNAFERDLARLSGGEEGYYIIADLNGLKKLNDTVGHSAGDELLRGFARLLADTVGENGRAYRQGGDEFAVLCKSDAQQFIRDLDEARVRYNRFCNIQISYAIGYCALAEDDFMDRADRMMYENKRRMKLRDKALARPDDRLG